MTLINQKYWIVKYQASIGTLSPVYLSTHVAITTFIPATGSILSNADLLAVILAP